MKIIIVDPDMGRQRQLRTILTSLGNKSADLDATNDGRSMSGLMRKKKFDVAFFCHIPGQFDGLQLVEEMRGGTSRGLPIVLYSTNMDRETLLKANQLGANGFLSYPFTVNDVEEAIKTAQKRIAG